MTNKLISILGLLFILGCSNPFKIEGFDDQGFRNDANGCSGIRNEMQDKIFEVKSQLLGHTQPEILKLLGKPDLQEIADRGQDFFIYYIEPAPDCSDSPDEELPLTMYVRFSALEKVSEVSFQNY